MLVCIVGVQPVLAQDPETHKVQLPDDEWEADHTEAASGQTVTIKYNGSKYVKDLQIIPLPSSITFASSCLAISLNETVSLEPALQFQPDNDDVDKTVTWESSAPDVVSVNETTGEVTPKAIGSATITATTKYNNKTASITISVVAAQDNFTEQAFSVSESKQVAFSKGNLQYNVNDKTWRFAEHQWDFVGGTDISITNGNAYIGNVVGSTNTSAAGPWIDLFGWGTWTVNGADPTSVSTNYSDYETGVVNSGDFENVCKEGIGSEWMTLTSSEWTYLISTRTTKKGIRYSKAVVHCINGLVLLPDEWNGTYTFANSNTSGAAFAEISDAVWATLEAEGAVFLPAVGYRGGPSGTDVYYVGSVGLYWSSTACGTTNAYYSGVHSDDVYLESDIFRSYGFSVRLVHVANE